MPEFICSLGEALPGPAPQTLPTRSGGLAERLLGSPPDILDCIAALSTDEVPTPPWLANRMLDLLPAEVWTNPLLRWLDPSVKSGVFLREVAKRLLHGVPKDDSAGRVSTPGLRLMIPNENARRNHIFRQMLWGLAITDLTGEMSRRTVYYTPDASSNLAVVPMVHAQGNVRFVPAEHSFAKDGNCSVCGATQALERGEFRENYAYAFIHQQTLPEGYPVKFDVIIGNPPYQLSDGGHGASASPIYHKFVDAAIQMDPRYIVMITPSRWFAGGKGLDTYRAERLADRRMKSLVDYPKLYDCFPDAEIKGGVSYFLWDRGHNDDCTVQTMWEGKPLGLPMKRSLNAYDVFVRRNEAVSIIEKVQDKRANGRAEPTLSANVSSRKPFGLPTNFHGGDTANGLVDPVRLYGSKRVSWVERKDIPVHAEWVDGWKVLTPAAGDGHGRIPAIVTGEPIVAGPGEACTETYLVASRFDTEVEARRFADYLRTKFVRFMIHQRKNTQHVKAERFAFVPNLPMTQDWTDDLLFARYGLTADEAIFIEAEIKPMLASGAANAPAPAKKRAARKAA